MEEFKSQGPEKYKDENVDLSRRGFLKKAGAVFATTLVRQETLAHFVMPENREIPSEKSLLETFNLLRGEYECTERRRHGDDNGIYLWELEFKIEGGTAEFGYMRKGKHAVGGEASRSKIYLTFFDETGIPEGGTDVAEFKEGQWKVDFATLEKYSVA